jgi:hypothetical protein
MPESKKHFHQISLQIIKANEAVLRFLQALKKTSSSIPNSLQFHYCLFFSNDSNDAFGVSFIFNELKYERKSPLDTLYNHQHELIG